MPVLGQGIIPAGSVGTELTYVTRRAFVPKMIVQIYNNTPLLANLRIDVTLVCLEMRGPSNYTGG